MVIFHSFLYVYQRALSTAGVSSAWRRHPVPAMSGRPMMFCEVPLTPKAHPDSGQSASSVKDVFVHNLGSATPKFSLSLCVYTLYIYICHYIYTLYIYTHYIYIHIIYIYTHYIYTHYIYIHTYIIYTYIYYIYTLYIYTHLYASCIPILYTGSFTTHPRGLARRAVISL